MFRFLRYLLLLSLSLLATAALLIFIFGGRQLVSKAWHALRKDQPKVEKTAPVLRPEKTVRFIEGWNNREMGQYLEGQGIWQSEEFLEAAGFPQVDYSKEKDMPKPLDFSSQYSFLKDKPDNYGLEGYLYPDTYRIYAASSTPKDLIVKMLDNFDKHLTPKMRADIKSQGKTIYQIVTMASILEKEAPINYATGDNHDARVISGIFWDRIKNGQPLQSCATLAYVLGVNKAQYSQADTEVKSPYNTYQHQGLPPGPISNPGILAIEAAIYPIYTDYNYFLTPAGSSRIIYSRTYAEHLRNKNKYLP